MRPGFMKSFHTLSVCFVIIPLMGPIPRLMQLCHTYWLSNTTGMDSVLFWLWVYPAPSWSNSKIDAVTFVTPVDFTTRQVLTLFYYNYGRANMTGNGDCYKPPKQNTILFGNPQSIIFGLIIVHSCHTLWGETDRRFNNLILVTLFIYCKNICYIV